jgi:hypothetical protein
MELPEYEAKMMIRNRLVEPVRETLMRGFEGVAEHIDNVRDRWDRSHAVQAGARQYAGSAVPCRTWSSLRPPQVDLAASFCMCLART